MDPGSLLPILVLLPLLCGGASLVLNSARTVLRFCAAGTLATAALAAGAAALAFRSGPLSAAGQWFRLDALSAYHLCLMGLVFTLCALYGLIYFADEIDAGHFPLKTARRYGGLWFGSLAAMILVLVSNNLGVMWVGIEATTLLTAFLICIHASPGALEAMWKYLVMCSVGVAVAFTGTLLIAASTGAGAVHGADALLWSSLYESAARLDPELLKAGFLFLVVGYGTKAGLAPMHNWLPDAHSQAPAPVSAIFSGFLLNAALYCILRCLPVVEAATGNTGWARGVLAVLGTLSVLVAAVFIVAQRDVKRLLAYSSVEHIGIMALGVGLGGAGSVAALLHMLGHSLAKPLAFFCSGRVGQACGTHDMRRMTGMLRISPVWGRGLLVGLLALVGVAPGAIFLSEFLVLKAAVEAGSFWIAAAFLAGLAIVFIGILRHAIALAWDPPPADVAPRPAGAGEALLVMVPVAALLVLGVWLPAPLQAALSQASALLGGAR